MELLKRIGTLPWAVSIFTLLIFSMMELKMDQSMLLFNRFVSGAGWIQIGFLTLYGGFLAYKMKDAGKSAKWRKRSWLIFSIWFFIQFFLGIIADERFLMTGKLHLPLPFMIAAGPVYRAQMSIMPILLLSSLVLSGPAWCSHFCYFGAWDQQSSGLKAYGLRLKGSGEEKVKGLKMAHNRFMRMPLRNKWFWKGSTLVVVVLSAWVFRMLGLSGMQTLVPALVLGGIGIAIMVFVSRKRHKMAHCVSFCPIGTLVNFGKYISPFRMKIESNCTNCMRCIPSCSYDALNIKDIQAGKPGITCTLCGDCVTSCEVSAIQYRFFKLNPTAARNLYLFITISIHIICLGLARI